MTTPVQELRRLAAHLSDVSEGIACKGTALEKVTFKVRKKAFLFLGRADAMFKLHASLPEAKAIAGRAPSQCKVGANGWVSLKFTDDESVPLDVLTRWMQESYQLFASEKKSEASKKKARPKKQVRKSK